MEQPFDRLEAAGNALRVVESIDAEHDAPAAGVPADRRRLSDDLGVPCERDEALRIDAHREHADLDFPLIHANAIDFRFDALHMKQGSEEMPHVREGVEPDQVRAEQAGQQLLAPRQDAEHLGRWKRRVQKKPMRASGRLWRTSIGRSMS